MSVIREVLTYRGVKVRPWMLKINQLLQGFISLWFLAGIGYLAYSNHEQLLALNRTLLLLLGALLLLVPFLVKFLHRYFEERFLFYKKWIRLYIMARYLKDHGFYLEKEIKTEKRVRKRIVFPKVYMRQGPYEVFISLELQGNKFQEKFLNLGADFETAFFMDFMDKVDSEKFITYKMAYAAFLNRIHASEVSYDPEKGVKLSKNFFWNFIEQPHLLVAGGTGGGKTTFIRAVLIALLKIGVVDACDPKRADFVPLENLPVLQGRVFYDFESIVSCFERAVEIMHNRMAYMRKLAAEQGKKELGSFVEYGLEPYFILCDEYNSLVAALSTGGSYALRDRFMAADKQLVLQGRQAGVIAIKLTQKPTADDLPTIIRDSMMMHISIGRLSDTGYPMMFGDENKNKRFKNFTRLAGKKVYRGYAAAVGELAQEYYSPLVTKGFSFYDVYETYPRIENPFNPLEGAGESLEIPTESVGEQVTLAAFARENDVPLSTARKIMELLAENGVQVENAAGTMLSDQDQSLLIQILADKRMTEDTYKVSVKRVLDLREEFADGAVQ